jgi:mRNA interferase MazF
VWWGETPNHGRRPYLVLTRDRAIGVLNEILVAVVTRTIRDIDTQVALDQADGMPEPCAANFDNLIMMPQSQLTERITSLSPARMEEVCAALGVAVDC